MGTRNFVAAIIATAIVFGGGGFYGGMAYQKSQAPALGGNGQLSGMVGRAAGTGGRSRSGRGNNGYRRLFGEGAKPVTGKIISQDNKSITIQLHDGSTRIIMLSDKTQISKATTGNKDDLKIGTRAFVVGTENSDGSISADMVSIGGRYAGLRSNNN